MAGVHVARRNRETKLPPHYRLNDFRPVVKTIMTRSASLRFEGNTLPCQLEHFDQPNEGCAAEALWATLTDQGARSLDKWSFRLRFTVAPSPTDALTIDYGQV